MFNINDSRSYASRGMLVKAIEKHNLNSYRHLIVCNESGRFTAIFGASQGPGVNVIAPAHLGFMVFG